MSEPKPRGLRRLAGRSGTFLTALIALVAAAVGLVFLFQPGLKPDPRERVGAAVEIFSVEPGVSTRAWLHEAFATRDVPAEIRRLFGVSKPATGELAALGSVVYVRVEVDGYKHRQVELQVRLYDLKTMQRLSRFPPQFNESSRPTIDAPNRRSVQLMFISDLSNERRRPEFLRVELVDSDTGRMLAVADSPALVKGRVSTR